MQSVKRKSFRWREMWLHWPQAALQMDADLDRVQALGANTVSVSNVEWLDDIQDLTGSTPPDISTRSRSTTGGRGMSSGPGSYGASKIAP